MTGSSKIANAGFLAGADVLIRVVLQFVVTAMMARLLKPEAFGQIAMLQVFLGVASVAVDSGLGTALIRRRVSTPAEESGVFYFSVGMGLLMWGFLCAAASWIERFFGQPDLGLVVVTLSSTILINALGSVHRALLTRNLDIGIQMRVGLWSLGFSGALGGVLGASGAGVWALVGQAIAAALCNVVLLWAQYPWRPQRRFQFKAIKPLLSFGWPLLVAGMLDVSVGRIYTVFLGRLQGPGALGQYSLAVTNQQLPQLLMASAAGRIFLPVASARGGDIPRLRSTMRSMLQTAMFLYLPCVAGLAVVSNDLIPALFGPKWEPSIVILQVLCLGSMLFPLNLLNVTALQALGESRTFLRLEIIKKVILLLLVVIAAQYGAVAIAASHSAAAAVSFALNAQPMTRLMGYGAFRQLADCARLMGAVAFMAATVLVIGAVLEGPAWAILVVQVLAGIVVYIAVCSLLRIVPDGARAIIVAALNRRSPEGNGTGAK